MAAIVPLMSRSSACHTPSAITFELCARTSISLWRVCVTYPSEYSGSALASGPEYSTSLRFQMQWSFD